MGVYQLIESMKNMLAQYEDVKEPVIVKYDSSTSPYAAKMGRKFCIVLNDADQSTEGLLSMMASFLHEFGHIAVRSAEQEYFKLRPDLPAETIRDLANVIEDIVVDRYVTVRGYSWQKLRRIFLLKNSVDILLNLQKNGAAPETVVTLYLLLRNQILNFPGLEQYQPIQDLMRALEKTLSDSGHTVTKYLNEILLKARNGERKTAFIMLSSFLYPRKNERENEGDTEQKQDNTTSGQQQSNVSDNSTDDIESEDIDYDDSQEQESDENVDAEDEEYNPENGVDNSDEDRQEEQDGEYDEDGVDSNESEDDRGDSNTDNFQEDVVEESGNADENDGGEDLQDTPNIGDVSVDKGVIESLQQVAAQVDEFIQGEMDKEKKGIASLVRPLFASVSGSDDLRDSFLKWRQPVPIPKEWLVEYKRIRLMSQGWEDRKRAGELRVGGVNIYSRLLQGKMDIFSKKTTSRKAKVGILIDVSASMRGETSIQAFTVAYLLQEFLLKSGNEVRLFIFNSRVTEIPRLNGAFDYGAGGTEIVPALMYAGSRVEYLFVITDAVFDINDYDVVSNYFYRKRGLIGVIGSEDYADFLPKWLAHGIKSQKDFKAYLSRAESLFR